MSSELGAILSDVNHRLNWFQESWQVQQPVPARADMAIYFTILRRLRIDVQQAYVRDKLAEGVGSPKTRLSVARKVSWSLTLLTVLLTCGCAAWMAGGLTTSDPGFAIVTSVIAFLGVAAILIRLIIEGLQLVADTNRYEWYADAVSEVRSRFNDQGNAARLSALRDLEEITYREMREFLKSHSEAKFNIS